MTTPGDPRLARALIDWVPTGWRDLPWRRTRDPWKVLVSELMLQQTQAARVVPKYAAFVERWPTPTACAAASSADVVTAWAGLGYNRRALALHRAAGAIVERHAGRVPRDLSALQALPGVGPYTARAVLAFAFEDDVGVVDVNVARVITRAVAGRRLPHQQVQVLADELVPSGQAWLWNQAMLDLGAQVCTARRPSCDNCPIRAHCAWTGGPDPAVGLSARQSRFDGSDRQGRGRLLDALRAGPLPATDVACACGWPDDWSRADRIASQLVEDGFAIRTAGKLTLR